MKFRMLSVFVNDQAEAERFYVDKLGLQVKHDIPIGADRWLTVISPDDPDGPELLLEPSGHPAVIVRQSTSGSRTLASSSRNRPQIWARWLPPYSMIPVAIWCSWHSSTAS